MHHFSVIITQFVLATLFHYRYVFLFPMLFLEATMVMMACGFLVSIHAMNPLIALPILILGDLGSDYMYYFFGRYGKKLKIVRYFMRTSRFDERKDAIESGFHKHSGKILVIGKLTYAFAMPVLIGAGYFKMNLKRFFSFNFIGAVIKCSVLLYLGYLVGAAYERYAKHLEYQLFIASALPIFILVAAPYFIERFSRKPQIL